MEQQVYLTSREAANYANLSESYLAKLRMGTGPQVGPNFLKIGSRAIRYRQVDLDAWMETKSRVQIQFAGGRRP